MFGDDKHQNFRVIVDSRMFKCSTFELEKFEMPQEHKKPRRVVKGFSLSDRLKIHGLNISVDEPEDGYTTCTVKMSLRNVSDIFLENILFLLHIMTPKAKKLKQLKTPII